MTLAGILICIAVLIELAAAAWAAINARRF